MKKTIVFSVIVVILILISSSSFYIVNEDEVAVVKTMGKIVSVVTNPGDKAEVMNNYEGSEFSGVKVNDTKGLHFKLPLVQTVEKYSSKYLTYTSLAESVNTVDGRRVEIQMYSQYRVIDPAIFNAVVGDEGKANQKMDAEVYPTVINSVNKLQFNEFFDQETLEDLLNQRQEEVNARFVKEFGIYISDIGISRKTFPADNIATIEEKMIKEIEKDSAQSIAEGDSIYNQKVAQVDAEKAQIIANAVEEAAIIKADADAEAIRTYQDALGVDLEFYQFIQRMEIYKELKGSTFFLDKDNELFEFINGARGDVSTENSVNINTGVTE